MPQWERWQGELLHSLQDITTYSHLGLVFTLIPNNEISIDQEEKDLHLSIKAMVYKKYYNSISQFHYYFTLTSYLFFICHVSPAATVYSF